MSSNSAIEGLIREAIAVVMGVEADSIDASTSLVDYGLDSLKVVELVVELERSSGVDFPDEDLVAENFENVHAIARVISRFAHSVTNHAWQNRGNMV